MKCIKSYKNSFLTQRELKFCVEYEQAYDKLKSIDQLHLLDTWSSLTPDQQALLLTQTQQLDSNVLHTQLNALKTSSVNPIPSLEPFHHYSAIGNDEDKARGQELISQGLMGCLIVAGGQGTRLGFNGPKGLFPISLIKHKSLFQLFAEKTLAASKLAKRSLPLAIMTSPLNHEETVNFFKENHFFGLQVSQVDFFSQGLLPFLDRDGKLFFDKEPIIAQGPNGNGFSLHHFYSSGLWKQWNKNGIRYLNYILVDNPLADPFDAELLGAHYRKESEITVKCTLKQNANEKVGVLVSSQDKVRVVEYSEMPENEKKATNLDGSLRHSCANLSLFCFSMDFIQSVAEKGLMPLHPVLKKVGVGKEMTAWKFESYIFDLLPLAKKVHALLYPRESCFAPLKNLEGEDSVYTVQQALLKSDQRILSKITGIKPPEYPFELSQEFYYPTPELINTWKGKTPTTNYIAS